MRKPRPVTISMERVDRDSKISCNQQLKELLRGIIRDNWRNPKFVMPSEEWLCEYHGLARGTVRKAIGEMVDEGLLVRRPGKGTYINSSCGEEQLLNRVGGLIALITTLGPNSFTVTDMAFGIDNVCTRHGYFLVLKGTGVHQAESEAKLLGILGRRCEGIISYSTCDKSLIPVYKKLIDDGVPLVMVDRYFPELNIDKVVVEEKAGMKTATEYMIGLGCRRIIYLNVPDNLTSVELRLAGFMDAVLEHPEVSYRIEEQLFLGLENNQTDRRPLRRLIDQELKDWPNTGFVCIHDGLAALAYDACRDAGIPVPERVMIMGYGDEPSSRERNLSTMHFSFEDMGKEAATILLDKIERRSRKRQHLMIHSDIIVRGSTATIK